MYVVFFFSTFLSIGATQYEIQKNVNVDEEFIAFYKKPDVPVSWTKVWYLSEDERAHLCKDVYSALYHYNPERKRFKASPYSDDEYSLYWAADKVAYVANVLLCYAYDVTSEDEPHEELSLKYYLGEAENDCIFVINLFGAAVSTDAERDPQIGITVTKDDEEEEEEEDNDELYEEESDLSGEEDIFEKYKAYLRYKVCPKTI